MKRIAFFVLFLVSAVPAWAADEKIEMSTYVPAILNGDLDRLHAKRATVGNPYTLSGGPPTPNPSDTELKDGYLWVSKMIGIGNFIVGPSLDTQLRIRGADDAITRVVFERGTDTPAPGGAALWVGIGTSDPRQILDIVERDDAAYLRIRAGGVAGENYDALELIASDSADGILWQLAHKRVGAGVLFADHDFHINYRTANPGGAWSTKLAITPAGNVGIGTVNPTGNTTAGTNVLAIADGTAPVGGRNGQVLLYADAELAVTELFALDGAGNATKLSPHNPETGEWEFYSKNTRTGRVVRIRMEELVREFERLTGKKFVDEWTEDPQN